MSDLPGRRTLYITAGDAFIQAVTWATDDIPNDWSTYDVKWTFTANGVEVFVATVLNLGLALSDNDTRLTLTLTGEDTADFLAYADMEHRLRLIDVDKSILTGGVVIRG
jgi:hypothetical protein